MPEAQPTSITRSTAISRDRTPIAVHDFGGEGALLVLAPATGFCAMTYGPMAAELTSRARVVAIDFRGHGDSGLPADGNLAWTEMAQDLLAVLDHFEAPNAHVFGHSMGGAAALLAEKDRPGSVRSAYLFEPIVFPDDMPEARPNPMSGPARARRASFPSRAAALERYASRPPLNLMRADALAAYVTYGFADQPDGSVTLKCSPETEASTFECEVKVKTSVIAGITTPITVGVGVDEEGPNPARLGPPTVDVLPNARLERFDRLGHFGPFQDPPAMADAIADHLSWAAQSRT